MSGGPESTEQPEDKRCGGDGGTDAPDKRVELCAQAMQLVLIGGVFEPQSLNVGRLALHVPTLDIREIELAVVRGRDQFLSA
jgi:hypothetical protein